MSKILSTTGKVTHCTDKQTDFKVNLPIIEMFFLLQKDRKSA